MASSHFTSTFLLSLLLLLSVTKAWKLSQRFDASNWAEKFEAELAHVNQEFVNYLNIADARNRRLIYTNGSSLVVKADSERVISPGSPGRDSVRLRSKQAFSHGLFIADFEHMPPQQCGLWPSFFLLGPHWPQDGEIDIIEGVNLLPHNQITIHTRGGCAPGVGPGGEAGARIGHRDCGADGGFVGCGVQHRAPNGYGAGMNAAGGGVYATLWTHEGVKVWHWPRRAAPRDALGQSPDPTRWGQPVANWGGGGCNYKDSFREMRIILQLTFCGDWAGKVWHDGECKQRAPDCKAYVAANPKAFVESYWKVKSIKVFDS